MTLEKRGIPTAFFCPEAFRGIVEAEARRSGVVSYKPVTIPGRVVALSAQQAIANMDRASKEIVERLTLA